MEEARRRGDLTSLATLDGLRLHRRAVRGAVAVAIILLAQVATTVPARSAEPRAPATVERVRYLVGPERVRVLVILSRTVPYEVLKLPPTDGHAPRLVVDFANARLGERARSAEGEAGEGLLALRTGQFNPRTARVVLELQGIAAHTTVRRDNPPRVVIDVEVPRAATGGEARSSPSRKGGGPKREHEGAGRKQVASVGRDAAKSSKPGAAAADRARWVVVIDPGHGGVDPGAVGIGGLTEKQVTLAISKKLAARLAKDPAIDVFLTRDRDVTLPLRARTAFANSHGADIFISIHTNADDTGKLSGVETFYLNNAGDHATVRLAAQENGLVPPGADLKIDRDVLYIVSDLVQSGKEEESIELARHVQMSLTRRLTRRRHRVNDLGVRKGPFFVLTGAYMPCVLVEVSFISHPREGRLLGDTRYQEEIADGVYQGILEFLRSSEVANTL